MTFLIAGTTRTVVLAESTVTLPFVDVNGRPPRFVAFGAAKVRGDVPAATAWNVIVARTPEPVLPPPRPIAPNATVPGVSVGPTGMAGGVRKSVIPETLTACIRALLYCNSTW